MKKVLVRRQQGQFVPPTQLNQERVDSADLNSSSSTGVSNLRSGYVILTIGLDQGEGTEPVDDRACGLGSRESLQQFLKNEPCRHDGVGAKKCLLQCADLGLGACTVAAQRQRPDAGIDKQRHLRSRSAL